MEILKILSNIKFKSYQLVFQFLFTITVPGILILFYFYRNIFMTFDLNRLIMLEVSISVIFLVFSFIVCSTVLLSVRIIHYDDEFFNDEESFAEGAFSMSTQVSLFMLFALLFIYYCVSSKCFQSFVIWFFACEIVFGIISFLSLNYVLNLIKKQTIKEEEEKRKADTDRVLKIELLTKELNKYKRLLIVQEAQKTDIVGFKLFRTAQEREKQILDINFKIEETNSKIKSLEKQIEQIIQ